MHFLVRLTAASLVLIILGCGTQPNREAWREAGGSLDRIASYLDEYGSITASDVLLVENKGQFAQDYSRTTQHYVDAARTGTTASVRIGEETSDSSRSSLRMSADLEALLASMGIVLPGKASAPPALPTPSANQPRAADAFAQAKLDPILTLGPLPTEVSERRAMIAGFDDKVTEQVLKYLLNPTEFPGKVIYVGVLEVNCAPGWRSREGYAADLCVTAFFAKQDSSGAWVSTRSDRRGRQPFVLAAFPFSEAQSIDQRRSLRSQIERAHLFAAALSFRGLAAEAESFRSYANRLQNDAASRTQLPVITTYSAGNAFGYQVRPSFRAIADPADPAAGSANRLDPLAFPALIMLVADADQVPGGQDAYTHVELLVSSRWLPLKPGAVQNTESDHLALVNDLAYVRQLFPKADDNSDSLHWEIERRYQFLSNFARGETRYTILPPAVSVPNPSPPHPPTLSAVQPVNGFANGPTTPVLAGAHFGKPNSTHVKRVLVGGVSCEFAAISDTVLVTVVPAGSFPGSNSKKPVTVVAATGAVTLADAVEFTMDASDPPDTPLGVIVDRNAKGEVIGIRVQGASQSSGDLLMATIRASLGQVGEVVQVDVSATGSPGPKK